MFMSNKTRLITSCKITLVKKFLQHCYFSGEIDQFVSRIKILEKLKNADEISKEIYENGKYILFLKGEMVCLKKNFKLVIKNYDEIKKLGKQEFSKTVLLNVLNEINTVCLFSVNFESFNSDDLQRLNHENDEKFIDVRRSLYFLDQEEAQFVTHARGLINFENCYKFCCYCGGNLKTKESGHQKICIKCQQVHYPSLSPVGLTLIEDENHEEVLLVRQERHPPGTYSCVAGFIEPGESLEANIKREVAEEVGLNVISVKYCFSQHWALPVSQLTLGCIATTLTKDFTIDPKEIQDAKWVKASELKDAVFRIWELKNFNEMNNNNLWAPPKNAVSHNLMVAWLRKFHGFDSSFHFQNIDFCRLQKCYELINIYLNL